MYDEYCLWAQVAVLLMLGLYCTVWNKYMQVLYLGRALRTKETLPDFLKWHRVTRHLLVFRGLTGSQQTPGKWGVTKTIFFLRFTGFRRSNLISPRIKVDLRDEGYAWVPESQDYAMVQGLGFHGNREKAVSREITPFEVGFFFYSG